MDILDNCSITTGCIASKNKTFIIVMNDELAQKQEQHGIPLLFKNGVWFPVSCEPIFPWIGAGVTNLGEDSSSVVFVGWGGQALVVDGDTCEREAILRENSLNCSVVRSVVTIENSQFIAGMRREVYKRTKEKSWVEIDHDVIYQGDKIDIGFNTINGFNCSEVYAAGANGEIWRYDSKKWFEVQAPTNVHLHALCCASDGYVYIGGTAGVIIRGRYNDWEVLGFDTRETIWDIHCFKGELYLITNEGLFKYKDESFEKIQDDLLDYRDFLCISSKKDTMIVFGLKRIVEYDGTTWSECSYTLSDTCKDSPILEFIQ